jgi:site-specific DNA recombinase
MRVAAYVRVSTEKQVREGNGLDEQRDSISEYCAAHGHEVVTWYEDAGISGAEVELREDMVRLIGDAKTPGRTFDAVVATKVDRLARSLYGQLFVEKELTTAGVGILYAHQENLAGSDPMTTAFRQMMAVFAELEKNLIKSRLSGGRLAKARKGGYAGGRAPMGFSAEKGRKTLEVDPSKVAAIRRVFEFRARGMTLRQIAALLNDEGLTTAEGASWQAAQVKRVLDRQLLYSGGYAYAGVSTEHGQHEAILSDGSV